MTVVNRRDGAAELVDSLRERFRLSHAVVREVDEPVGTKGRGVDRRPERDPRLVRADVRGCPLLADVLFARL